LQHFGGGEKVIRQGHDSNYLCIAILNQLPDQIGLKALRSNKPILNLISDCYIIIYGKAAMTVIRSLQTAKFFGKMTLFASEVSTVLYKASQYLEVVTLSATVVNQMIERQPSFAREISRILETRRAAVRSNLYCSFYDSHSMI
jgi:signal-transduction protein with cAMP-binding, CBS, and nucleotidyltransferase domain